MTRQALVDGVRRPSAPDADGGASADDHLAITDALLRFGAGTDAGDPAMIGTAFAEDATVDFGPCGRKLGLDFAPLRGRDVIVGFLTGTTARQVTSHVVTNARVRLAGGDAGLRALVDATHIWKADGNRRFQMMNWYEAELGFERGAWRLRHLIIDNLWFDGDPTTILHR